MGRYGRRADTELLRGKYGYGGDVEGMRANTGLLCGDMDAEQPSCSYTYYSAFRKFLSGIRRQRRQPLGIPELFVFNSKLATALFGRNLFARFRLSRQDGEFLGEIFR